MMYAMKNAANHPPVSLGLGGDGDEIAAITEVERRFGVRLDYVDARHWVTVGDVFTALKQALPSEQANDSGTWLLFAKAIPNETGVDPEQVTSDTLLLGKALFDMRIVLVVASILGVSLAIVRYM
nr:hypothetical protein [Polymorphobacter sp.]